jgi:outer membrane lipoprotein-sorting protein
MKLTKRNELFLPAVLALFAVSGMALAARAEPPSRLTANFVMERTLKVLSDTVRSSGRLSLGGPGLLRWEMTSPSRSTLVVSGGRGWIHYPDLELTKAFDLATDPVMRVISEHMLALTAGDFDAIGVLFRVSDLDGGVKRLLPREETVRSVFAELRVAFAAPGIVGWVELVSPGGDRTRLTFTDVRTDPVLDPALFREPVN